jgi:hypothetical protein
MCLKFWICWLLTKRKREIVRREREGEKERERRQALVEKRPSIVGGMTPDRVKRLERYKSYG